MRAHALRLVRLMVPGGNPVSRGVDRAEAVSLLLLVVLGAVLVPIMLMAGSLTYGSILATAEQQTRTRHQVVAVLVEDPPPADANGNGRALARWPTPAGPQTGRVPAGQGKSAGDRVHTWLDEYGHPAVAPATPEDAAVGAALVAITGWLTAAGLLGLVHSGVKQLLDRRRYREWAREWARVEPRWRTGST
ncbi:MAG TPA: hypothetical protein VGP26_26495 [Actinophytocola sp.]|nr:hypothetical protein [Actinophytocola sp.]